MRDGLGKLIQLDGTVYEGGWEQDRRSGKGRLIDGFTGDVYIGDFQDGKRQGRGKVYQRSLDVIYDGEWSTDNKQGEGFVLHRNGRLEQGDYRGGLLEGKSQLTQTLSPEETERVFAVVMTQREAFIAVSPAKPVRGQSGMKLRRTDIFANAPQMI